MVFILALVMGLLAQVSYKAVSLSKSRIGYGFGSQTAFKIASLGISSVFLCIVPTSFIVGAGISFIDGIIFFAIAIFGGALLAPVAIAIFGITGSRLIALVTLPINIILMFVALSAL